MQKNKNKIFGFRLIFISIFIISNSVLYAQWSFGFSTDQEYNTNPFRSPFATKSLVSSYDIAAENALETFSLGYYGSYININSEPERNFYWHQFALWKENENSTLGIYGEQRINKELYSYFDYNNITAYYQLKFQLDDFYFSIAPNVSYTKYNNISILDNLKGSFGFSINHGFNTNTTLILGNVINYKKYLTPTQSGSYSYLDASNNLITENYSDENVSSITQVIPYIRVAQSITETTGLAAQFTYRSILNGFANEVRELNMVYGDESEIFDDPVNNEGNSLAFEATQILFEDLTIKTGYYINKKSYPSQGIYNVNSEYDINILRSDTQNIFNLSINKRFTLGSNDNLGLSLSFNLQSIKNRSNSYWFNYNSTSYNLSIGLEF